MKFIETEIELDFFVSPSFSQHRADKRKYYSRHYNGSRRYWLENAWRTRLSDRRDNPVKHVGVKRHPRARASTPSHRDNQWRMCTRKVEQKWERKRVLWRS